MAQRETDPCGRAIRALLEQLTGSSAEVVSSPLTYSARDQDGYSPSPDDLSPFTTIPRPKRVGKSERILDQTAFDVRLRAVTATGLVSADSGWTHAGRGDWHCCLCADADPSRLRHTSPISFLSHSGRRANTRAVNYVGPLLSDGRELERRAMALENALEDRGLFVCRHCGHRAEVEVDANAEVLVEAGSRQDARTSLGLAQCPKCHRRDTKVVLVEALLPTLGGLGIAVVLSFVFVFIGMLIIADSDARQNDARFPLMAVIAIALAVACGAAFVTWSLRKAFRRAAANVSFGRQMPDAAADAGPYRSEPPLEQLGRPDWRVPLQQRKSFALGLIAFSGLLIGFMGSGSLPIQLIVGLVGASVAGVVRGKVVKDRILFASAFVIAEIGIVVATRIYIEGRSSVWNFELLIPLLLGSVPGLIVYVLVGKFGISKRPVEG